MHKWASPMRACAQLWTAALLLPCLAFPACRDAEDGDEPEAETEPPRVFDPEAPALLEPAADEVAIAVTRVPDLEITVEGVVTGLTSVLIDGISLGPMQSGSVDGTLTGESLRLRMGGALFSVDHTLSLRTLTDEEELTSRELVLVVEPRLPPTVIAELGPTSELSFATMFATGQGAAAVLVGLTPDDPSLGATIVPIEGAATWNPRAAVNVALPGWNPDDEAGASIAVSRVLVDKSASGDRLRVAWRTGAAGDGLRMADATFDSRVFPPAELFQLDPQTLGAAEFGSVGRPLILGNTVVAELLLARDVEQPRPGDHTLVTIHLEGKPARGQTPRVSTIAVGTDIDRISPVLDLRATTNGADPVFAARVASVTPVIFELDRASGVPHRRETAANDRLATFADIASPPITILGAFASRTIFAPLLGATPRALVVQFNDRSPDGRQDASPRPQSVAELGDPSAPPVGTVIDGTALFILPMGPDDDAVAFALSGPQAEIRRIEGLRCDQIAVSFTRAGNDEGRAAVACRNGTAVRLGELRTESP